MGAPRSIGWPGRQNPSIAMRFAACSIVRERNLCVAIGDDDTQVATSRVKSPADIGDVIVVLSTSAGGAPDATAMSGSHAGRRGDNNSTGPRELKSLLRRGRYLRAFKFGIASRRGPRNRRNTPITGRRAAAAGVRKGGAYLTSAQA